MSSSTLYLHEVVDIVGEGARPYMDLMVRTNTDSIADRGMKLFGTWQVVGMTGRWPQVINMWEIDGWEGWRRSLIAANLKRAENKALADWWDDAYRHRSGGFDRLLQARTVAPARGELFVHEISTVKPGAGPDYLAALEEQWVPVAAEHGHTRVGSFEVLFTDTEVVTMWATSLDDHIAFESGDDERVGRWRLASRQFLTRWREELMVPGPGSPLGPEMAQ
ncbi:MAG: hypothetical protein QOJ09_872 [Actinomycetota bacterium]|nr:hypothetical protein [Actinomycetota bacterium]